VLTFFSIADAAETLAWDVETSRLGGGTRYIICYGTYSLLWRVEQAQEQEHTADANSGPSLSAAAAGSPAIASFARRPLDWTWLDLT
jgi:hypothetical protein